MGSKYLNSIENGLWVAVIGSRLMQDKITVHNWLNKNKAKISVIVSGGASGPDSFAEEWAKEAGIPFVGFYAKWHAEDGSLDRGAGFRRNHKIIANADVVVAFWDGKSSGTAHSIEMAKQQNKRTIILDFLGAPLKLSLPPVQLFVNNNQDTIELSEQDFA